ncbi:MAG: extracellular solute-binding protein [Anaerolineae bacterium]
MSCNRLTRRALLRYAAMAGSTLLVQACQPKIVEKTVVVQGTPQIIEKVITPTPAPKEAPKGPANLRLSVWAWGPDMNTYLTILQAFDKKNPDIKVTAEQYMGDYYAKVQANFAAGNSADIVYTQGWMYQPYAESDVLTDLGPFIDKEGVKDLWPEFESYKQACIWREHYYMSPTDTGGLCLIYNKDIFDKKGLAYPTDEWTYDQFVDAATRLSFKEGDTKYFGYIEHQMYNDLWLLPMRKDGLLEWDRIVEPTKALWDQPAIVDALQWFAVDVYQQAIAPMPSETAGGAVSFWAGQVAMSIFGPWYLSLLWGDKATKKDGINYGAVAVPKGKSGRVETMPYIHGHLMSKATQWPDAAFKVMTYVLGDEAQKIIADGGRMPGQSKIIDEYWSGLVKTKYNLDNPRAFVTGLQQGRFSIIAGAGANVSALRAAGQPLPSAMEAMRNGKPAKEVIPDLNAALQKTLDEYWKARS